MDAIEFNTHTKSPGWVPLKKLFVDSKPEFLQVHAGRRFAEKHLIGAALWNWLCETGRLSPELRSQAEAIHFRPGKEKDGLPLWRLAFKATLRNTPEIDALFAGARKGPTPRYARLAAAGVVPPKPDDFVPSAADDGPGPPDGRERTVVPGYLAQQEWVLHDDGAEWVYVYSTQRELDNFANAGIEPLLKIGQTRVHYSQRMAGQTGSTASNSRFVGVLAYRVRGSQLLESALHKALKVQDRHVGDAPGIEWFQITVDGLHTLVKDVSGKTPRSSGEN